MTALDHTAWIISGNAPRAEVKHISFGNEAGVRPFASSPPSALTGPSSPNYQIRPSQAEPAIAEIIDGARLRLKFCVACGNNNQDELHHHHLIAGSQGGSEEEPTRSRSALSVTGSFTGSSAGTSIVTWYETDMIAFGLWGPGPAGRSAASASRRRRGEREVAAALLRGDRGMRKIARELSVGVSVV